jgi:RNA polymerase subunit RPABC4/transcription elongation factor Spt4
MSKPVKIIHVTKCEIHGKQSDKWEGTQIITKTPNTKKQKQAGCPVCKKENQI